MNLMVIIYICFKKIKYSLMAQWIARMTSDHKVGGSSPSGVVLFCQEAKKDNKGIKLIKEFLLTMYKKFGAVNNKRDDE